MSDESEVDRVLAQYGPGTAPYVHDPEDLHSLGTISSMNPTYAPGLRASGNVEDRSQTDPSSHVWSPYFRSQFWGMSFPPPQPHPSSQWQPDAIANERDFVAMPRADGGEVLAQYGQGSEPSDYSTSYNSALPPQVEDRFQDWVREQSQSTGRDVAQDLRDYDLRGWWQNTGGQALTGAHLTDRWKKPNHPTFSSESRFHGVEGLNGGEWSQLPDGTWQFVPGQTNVQMHGPENLQSYFQRIEPANRLVLTPPEEAKGFAEGGEVERVLSQYGQGYTSPQLNSGDGEIASTPDVLAQYGASERMSSGVPGFLRRIGQGLRGLAPSQVTTPVNTLTGREPNLRGREDHANPLMLMGAEGADTMASWMDMHPGVDRGQSRPQDLLAPLGLSAMAPLTAVNNAAGIFGGRLARTADREALSRAEEMAARGMDRDTIRNQTGWFQGRGGQWLFEIDDSGAALSPRTAQLFEGNRPALMTMEERMAERAQHNTVLPRAMDHPDLYAAYPDLAYTGVSTRRATENRGGSYLPEVDRIEARSSTPDEARSTLLHEAQHAIQQREGLPRGAGITDFTYQNSPLFSERRSYETPAQAYHRVAGEVEARNVQGRQDFTPEERRARPPWETQDVPDADQILRQYSQGPQMSAPDTKGPPRDRSRPVPVPTEFHEPWVPFTPSPPPVRALEEMRPETLRQIEDYRKERIFIRPEDQVTEAVMPLSAFNGKDITASQAIIGRGGLLRYQREIRNGARPAILLEMTPQGNYRIIDGHTRATAYHRLGIEDIPVIIRQRPPRE